MQYTRKAISIMMGLQLPSLCSQILFLVNAFQIFEIPLQYIYIYAFHCNVSPYPLQVEFTHSFTVIAGINGAGLTNCLFLPTGAVAIQLVPFNATNLNYKDFGILLKSRGHYLEWHSSDSESSIKPPDGGFENADTIVNSNQFVTTLVKALTLGINKNLIAGGI